MGVFTQQPKEGQWLAASVGVLGSNQSPSYRGLGYVRGGRENAWDWLRRPDMPSTASPLATLLFGLSLLGPIVLVLAGLVVALVTRPKR